MPLWKCTSKPLASSDNYGAAGKPPHLSGALRVALPLLTLLVCGAQGSREVETMTYDELQALTVDVGSSHTDLEQAIKDVYTTAYYLTVDCSPNAPEIPFSLYDDLAKLFAVVGLPGLE